MNKEFILINLEEARQELARMVLDLQEDRDYEYGNYIVDMMHLYHHVNTAWNAREATNEEVSLMTDGKFYQWRAFPTDINMS